VALTKSQQREHNLAVELDRLQRACQNQGVSISSALSPPRQPGAQPTSLRGVPPSARACDVDAATLGMSFVLKLVLSLFHSLEKVPKPSLCMTE